MYMKSLLIAAAVILGAAMTISLPQALSEQCKVKWSFGISCPEVYEDLVNQIKAWQTGSCRSGGANCSYQLLSATPDLIKARHISPESKHVDDLQFALAAAEAAACKLSGDSVSEAVDPADNSTSYCSLQNLVEGSGLSKAAGYKPFTNKWICPASATANCSIV